MHVLHFGVIVHALHFGVIVHALHFGVIVYALHFGVIVYAHIGGNSKAVSTIERKRVLEARILLRW